MKYISTRGEAPALNFEEVLLAGLASDGGLYVPESLPSYSAEQMEAFSKLPYDKLAFELLKPFVQDSIPEADFQSILEDTYQSFEHPAIAPLIQIAPNEWVLELFQGPTLAFKDFALQLLGRLLDYVLKRRNQRVVIMGATSGDTGSAAIEGCRRCENVDIFILHPHNRVSEVQRRQMTTVLADNVHNIAIEGNFDDCQALVKASFRDQSFLPGDMSLVAVNSINWARIMAQIVYYFYAALKLGAPQRAVTFTVPTGNFGDIFAGYLAKKMGLPVANLVIATNRNDVLHDALAHGMYKQKDLHKTLSPSMDISVSSNFERLLFDLFKRDGDYLRSLMESFAEQGIAFPDAQLTALRAEFDSCTIDDNKTCEIISEIYNSTGYLVDPHTATGIGASAVCRKNQDEIIVNLATAHPAKFPEAVEKSGVAATAEVPPHMSDLFDRKEQYQVCENDITAVQSMMKQSIRT